MDLRKVTVLLDNNSRQNIKISLNELSKLGVIFVNQIEDLLEMELDKDNLVLILSDYLNLPVAKSKLKLYMRYIDARFVLLTNEKSKIITSSGFIEIYKGDYTQLNAELVNAILLHDNSLQSKELITRKLSGKVEMLLKHEDNAELREIYSRFITLETEHDELVAENGRLRNANDKLECQVKQVSASNKKLNKGYGKVVRDVIELNKTLQEYEAILTSDFYEKVDALKYEHRPFVLYFKDYEALNEEHLFLSTLYEVLQKQMHKSVKMIYLYDNNTCKQMRTLPKYCRILGNRYNSIELTGNVLAKAGDYKETLDLLLTNKSGLDFLIVVDCKSLNDTVMIGYDLAFNFCRNYKHLESYSLDKVNSIVENTEDEDFLSFVVGKDDLLEDKDETFLKLSSKKIFAKIMNAIRMRGGEHI